MLAADNVIVWAKYVKSHQDALVIMNELYKDIKINNLS